MNGFGRAVKHVIPPIVVGLLLTSPALAETPCDFKGVSVGSRMSPAEIMSGLGVSQYKTDPSQPSDMALVQKCGLIAAADINEWNIGPFCDERHCVVPYGVRVGNANGIPVKAIVSFHAGQIIEIVVQFGETFWEEVMPIIDQKYGGNWKVEHEDMAVMNYENKKSQMVQRTYIEHITNGTNPSTKDRCKIWATNYDVVFEHHDAFGPYHSEIVIQLISKNF
jgi:hypothetical protein